MWTGKSARVSSVIGDLLQGDSSSVYLRRRDLMAVGSTQGWAAAASLGLANLVTAEWNRTPSIQFGHPDRWKWWMKGRRTRTDCFSRLTYSPDWQPLVVRFVIKWLCNRSGTSGGLTRTYRRSKHLGVDETGVLWKLVEGKRDGWIILLIPVT